MGFILNWVSPLLTNQNIPAMMEFETRIKFSEDSARPPLQISEKEYSSLPQDRIYPTSLFFQLQKNREADSSIQEDNKDTTLMRHSLSSSFYQTFLIPLCLVMPTTGFETHPGSLVCSQKPGHLSPKSP